MGFSGNEAENGMTVTGGASVIASSGLQILIVGVLLSGSLLHAPTWHCTQCPFASHSFHPTHRLFHVFFRICIPTISYVTMKIVIALPNTFGSLAWPSFHFTVPLTSNWHSLILEVQFIFPSMHLTISFAIGTVCLLFHLEPQSNRLTAMIPMTFFLWMCILRARFYNMSWMWHHRCRRSSSTLIVCWQYAQCRSSPLWCLTCSLSAWPTLVLSAAWQCKSHLTSQQCSRLWKP